MFALGGSLDASAFESTSQFTNCMQCATWYLWVGALFEVNMLKFTNKWTKKKKKSEQK